MPNIARSGALNLHNGPHRFDDSTPSRGAIRCSRQPKRCTYMWVTPRKTPPRHPASTTAAPPFGIVKAGPERLATSGRHGALRSPHLPPGTYAPSKHGERSSTEPRPCSPALHRTVTPTRNPEPSRNRPSSEAPIPWRSSARPMIPGPTILSTPLLTQFGLMPCLVTSNDAKRPTTLT